MARVRVFFLVADLSGGGAQRVVITMLSNLDRQRIEPILVLSRSAGEFLSNVPADVPILTLGRKGRSSLPRMILRLAILIRRYRPQVILSFLLHSNALAVMGKIASLRLGTKIIVSEHVSEVGYRKLPFYRLVRQATYPLATAIVAVAHGVRLDLSKHVRWVERKLAVIHNPIDIEAVRRSAQDGPGLCPDLPNVIMVARLTNQQKAGDLLLNAFAGVAKGVRARLTFVGDGPDLAALRRQAENLGIAHLVDFAGFRENPFPLVRSADVFVLPSHYEGFGCVLIEAMCLGVPVVATDCPHGPAEILLDGKCGILVPIGDETALRGAILKLLLDPALRADVAKTGQERAENFRPEYAISAYQELISKCAGT
jgi:glycosyltransferase involved in cell wall biosynthesis